MTHQDPSNVPDRELFMKHPGPQRYAVTYLASPYWHDSEEVLHARVAAARLVTAHLLKEGVPAFSPVSYSHNLVETTGVRPAHGWYEFDLHFLAHAAELRVLKLPGWEDSRGILLEKAFAQGRGIPVFHMEMDGIMPLLDRDTRQALEQI